MSETFDEFEHTRRRNGDHDSSADAAKGITPKAPNLRTRFLKAFQAAGERGLTDEEAAITLDLTDTCFWKRCNELRQAELIEFTDERRMGTKNQPRKVSVVTEFGAKAVKA